MLWELFSTFFLIGLFSFGGGYAIIPVIQTEVVERHGWMTAQQFSDIVAVAGMSPGPIATNSAIFVGYHQSGVMGAIVSAAGMVMPSLLLILAIGAVFYKFHKNFFVRSAFYGLRSVITALIVYAAILFAASNGFFASWSWHSASIVLIFAASLAALIYFRIHPVYVILLSGLVGVTLYG